MEFSLPIRVYIEDTDAGGVVYYVNYLKFMERGRTELLRSLGFDKAGANTSGVMFVVVAADVKYLRPARLDDQLQVVTTVRRKSSASIWFNQIVRRGEVDHSVVEENGGEICCEAAIRIACVLRAENDEFKPVAIPVEIGNAIKKYLPRED